MWLYYFSNFKWAITSFLHWMAPFNTHLLVGRVLVSRTDDVGRTVSHKEKRPTVELIQIPKRCCFIKTAARWTWKSSISKACVTTQLPNKLALKIDDAQARGFSLTVELLVFLPLAQHVGWRFGCGEVVAWAIMERPLVQILVIVATTQTRLPRPSPMRWPWKALRAVVEKVSL